VIRRILASILPRSAMPLARNAYALAYGLRDWSRPVDAPVPIAPAKLRYRVGAIDPIDYLAIGQRCAQDIRRAAEKSGVHWTALSDVLDFGCGAGRTLVWLSGSGPRLHACDRDEECVSWCQANIPDVTVRVNDPAPPLPFEDDAFDLVYAVSVFTHLDESEQDAWLRELRRVTRPHGIGVFSFHGASLAKQLSPENHQRLETHGILALPVRGLWGLFPTYYNTFHTESYVREHWTRFGPVLEIEARGMNGHQDLVVLRKETN